MLQNMSFLILGGMMVLSIVMMIGNVLSKGSFGKLWALVGGASLLLSGVLLISKPFLTTETKVVAPRTTASNSDLEMNSNNDPQTPNKTQTVGTTSIVDASSNDSSDLATIAIIWELLKENKPIPPQYQEMLKQPYNEGKQKVAP